MRLGPPSARHPDLRLPAPLKGDRLRPVTDGASVEAPRPFDPEAVIRLRLSVYVPSYGMPQRKARQPFPAPGAIPDVRIVIGGHATTVKMLCLHLSTVTWYSS